MEHEKSVSAEMYKVQLVDADGDGIEECIKCVHKGDIRRDRFYFSKSLIKRLIRECMTKENYIGAPWIVKVNRAGASFSDEVAAIVQHNLTDHPNLIPAIHRRALWH